jgi:hypothetical protein
MKEDSDRESEPEKWAKQIMFRIRFWVVEFLSKFQSDLTVGSKVTPLFVKHTHIASIVTVNVYKRWKFTTLNAHNKIHCN